MLSNLRQLFGVAVALCSLAAMASHAQDPLNLQQKTGTTPLAAGAIIPTGQVVDLYADSSSLTCNGASLTYQLEFEVIPTSQAFSGTPNYFSPMMAKPSCVQQTYPATSVSLPAGNYKWRVRERSSGNLCTSGCVGWINFNGGNSAFTVAPPNVPDILVTNVNMINTVLDTANNTLSFNVVGDFFDRGTVNTGNFVWNAYLSLDQQLQYGTDTLIYSSTTGIDVPGEQTLQDTSPTIVLNPRPPPGQYYILIEADPAPAGCTTNCGSVSEFDEANNVSSTANYFTNGFDLVATSLSNGPTNAGPGQTVTLNLSFFNQGIESPSSNPVEFRIVATRDASVSDDDFEVYRSSLTMSGGQSFTAPVTFTLPQGVAGGDVQWGLQVDPSRPGVPNPNVEANESNNTILTTGKTHIQQADLEADFADFVDVATGQPTRKGDIGFPGRVLVDATNVGDFLSPSHEACVVISGDNTLSLLRDEIFAQQTVPGIPSGANNSGHYDLAVTIPTTLNGSPLKTGDYFLFVYLDCENDINELNEANNTKVVIGPVRLRTPLADYAAVKVFAPATAAGGEALPLQRTFSNVGTDAAPATEYRCYASVNPIVTAQDFPLEFLNDDGTTGESKPLQLGMGETDEGTDRVRLPGTIPAGSYYLGCVVDPDNAVSELEENNNSAYTTAPVQVAAQTFRVVTQQLPDATLKTPYSFTLSAAGAPGPVTWTVDATPEGMSLDEQTGTLHGPPALAGLTRMRVQAHVGNIAAEAVLIARVLPNTSELTITTENLPAVTNSTSIEYQAVLSASGGAQPYVWSVISGSLPNGISLNGNTGEVSGSPRPGQPLTEVALTVQVKDSLGNSARKPMKLRMVAPGALIISTLSIPDTLLGADYFADLAAQVAGGGALSKPLEWSVIVGQLPAGLTLSNHSDQATGLITGKAQVAGMFPLTFQVKDADGRADSIDFVLHTYAAGLKVTLAAPPPSELHPGNEVDLQVTSAGGTGNATYRLFSGSLPAGVTLTEDGKLSGTLSEDATLGAYNFVVEAVDVSGGKGLGAFALEVVAEPKPQGCSSTGSAPWAGALFAALGMLAFASRRRQMR